jgi:hypothetical protein
LSRLRAHRRDLCERTPAPNQDESPDHRCATAHGGPDNEKKCADEQQSVGRNGEIRSCPSRSHKTLPKPGLWDAVSFRLHATVDYGSVRHLDSAMTTAGMKPVRPTQSPGGSHTAVEQARGDGGNRAQPCKASLSTNPTHRRCRIDGKQASVLPPPPAPRHCARLPQRSRSTNL